jgi:bifunctional non-homologous end joining protein LigD
MTDKTRVDVDGTTLALSNLDKVLYPDYGFTKGEVIDYYARIAEVLLPHVADRPATRKRYPNGVAEKAFFEKNTPGHAPDWVRRVTVRSPGSTTGRETLDYVLIEDLRTVVWLANLAAIELHVPQWRIVKRAREPVDPSASASDLMVFDLDPGSPATGVDACRVAVLLRELLDADGLAAYPKASGKKGVHLYVPVKPAPGERGSAYAKALAQRLESEHGDLVVSRMDKRLRRGRVFVDWSQNNPHKTTVAPYSLRAADEPSVSAPLTWDEVEGCEDPDDLRFLPQDVIDRVARHGDLLGPLLDTSGSGAVPSAAP